MLWLLIKLLWRIVKFVGFSIIFFLFWLIVNHRLYADEGGVLEATRGIWKDAG